MVLTHGARVGPYEILSAIGSGGMGEVYRARDTKLNRDVAIKVLRDQFASDAERLGRFTREAQTLASLNHPHIAHIHGIEESGGVRALVMELVEGEDLSQRIARGAIAPDEALPIAKQIAEALEAAHDQGIIHRDLKPANIKVRPDGTVKVLDFGLAKAMEPVGVPPDVEGQTITTPAMTHAGIILGTVAYMSPEQARGRPLDKRTDIWAFGCVLYEMLSGRQAFGAETISDSLAHVLSRDINWSRLPPGTPVSVRRLLRRCLERDLKARLHDAADARLEIEDAINGLSEGAASPDTRRPPWWSSPVVPWLAAGITVAVLAWSVVVGRFATPTAGETSPVRFTLRLPAGSSLSSGSPAIALAPDGMSFVVSLRRDSAGASSTRLELRRFDRPDFSPIPGGERGTRPFFLADGKRVGFLDAQTFELKVVDISGGPARVVCALGSSTLFGASPGPGDSIIFSHSLPGVRPTLKRVAVSGGEPVVIAEPDPGEGENGFLWPQVLPDNEHVLFSVDHTTRRNDLEVLSLKTAARRELLSGTIGQYLPSGHLVFLRVTGPADRLQGAGDLVAARFNATTFELDSEPVSFVEGLQWTPEANRTEFAMSGRAMMLSRRVSAEPQSLVWADRAGQISQTGAQDGLYRTLDLSPEGTRAAIGIDGPNRDIWTYDTTREIASRVTTSPEEEETPRWSPDGTRLAYAGNRDGKRHLLMISADGGGAEQRLWAADEHIHVNGWRSDGKVLYFMRTSGAGDDIWAYSFAEKTAAAFLQTKANEFGAAPSPDGRWIAYVSDESGRREVYLAPAIGAGRNQVSRDGGVEPVWSRDAKELFFKNTDGTELLVVAIASMPGPHIGAPRPVLRQSFAAGGRDPAFAVTPDGKRFLFIRSNQDAISAEIEVTLNWYEQLKRLVPGK